MAQTPWQDLIPYYVARSLPPAQMKAFEAQLARDPSLRTELEEWRRIAAAVWREADAAARRLPPLSPEIYQKLQYRNGAQPANPTTATLTGQRPQFKSRIGNSPLTLVAGFLVVFLCGGIILFSAAKQLQNPEIITTNVALNIATEFGGPAEATAVPTLNVCNTQPELCTTATIVPSAPPLKTWTPAPRATMTAVVVRPIPTNTPLRPLIQPSQTPRNTNLTVPTLPPIVINVPMTQTYEALYGTPTPWPDYLCVVTNSGDGARALYASADYSANVIGYWSAGETTWVMARTTSNWIEIYYGQWLPADNLIFRGPCDSVPAPSPTAVATLPVGTPISLECRVSDAGPNTSPLYETASTQAQIVNYLPVAESLYVIARSGNWYEVFYGGRLGWFQTNSNTISLSGDCGNVAFPSPTYVPTATTFVPDLSQQVLFSTPTFIVPKTQVSLRFLPSSSSNAAVTLEAGVKWGASGTLTVEGVQWISVVFDNSIYWVEASQVTLTDTYNSTATATP